jgi:hypothetical protein
MKDLVFKIMLLSLCAGATEVIKEGDAYPIEKIREQNQQIIKMVVAEISKTLPQRVDKYTQLTKIHDENITLVYTFEINSKTKSDERIKREDHFRMQKSVTKGACQSSKRFLDAGVELLYEYISATTHKELFAFHITQTICREFSYE